MSRERFTASVCLAVWHLLEGTARANGDPDRLRRPAAARALAANDGGILMDDDGYEGPAELVDGDARRRGRREADRALRPDQRLVQLVRPGRRVGRGRRAGRAPARARSCCARRSPPSTPRCPTSTRGAARASRDSARRRSRCSTTCPSRRSRFRSCQSTRPSPDVRTRRPSRTRSGARRSASSPTRSTTRTRCTASKAAAQELGHDDVIAPPTFAIVVTMRAGHQVIMDPDLGIDYSRVVHGEQRFEHTRPITRRRRAAGGRDRRLDPRRGGQRHRDHAQRGDHRRRRARPHRVLHHRREGSGQ